MRFSTDITQYALPDKDRKWHLKDDLFDRLTVKEGYAIASTALWLFLPYVEKEHPDKMVFVDEILRTLDNFLEGKGPIDEVNAAATALEVLLDEDTDSRLQAFALGGVMQWRLSADAIVTIWRAFQVYPQDIGKYLEWWVACLRRWVPLYDPDLYREKVSGLLERYIAREGIGLLDNLNNDDIYKLFVAFCRVYILSPLIAADEMPMYTEILEQAVIPGLLGPTGPDPEIWRERYEALTEDKRLGSRIMEPLSAHFRSQFPLLVLGRMTGALDLTFNIEHMGIVAGFSTKMEAYQWLISTAIKIVESYAGGPLFSAQDPFQIPILTVNDIVDEFRAKEYMGTQYGGAPSAHTVCVAFFNSAEATDEGDMVRDKAEVYPIGAFSPLSLDNRDALVFELDGESLYEGTLLFRSYSFSEKISPQDPFLSQHECLATNPVSARRTSLTADDSLQLYQLVRVLEQLPRETELFVRGEGFLAPIIGVCYYVDDSRVIFRAWKEPSS